MSGEPPYWIPNHVSGVDARDITVEDSEIDHFISPGVDAHGIGIQTAQRITVRRCYIHDNSADGVQTNTPDYPGYGRWASEILIEYNRLEHNGENGIDIKSTHGLTARYNRIAGYRAAGGGEGIALEVQYDAQDIVIEGNDH